MSRLGNSSPPSFAEPKIAKIGKLSGGSPAVGLLHIAGFGGAIVLTAYALSLLAAPWVDLPFWKIFRRCASIAAALTSWLFITRYRHLSWRHYGLTPLREGKHAFAFGAGLGLASLGVLLLLGLLTGSAHIHLHPNTAKLWRTLIGFLPAAALVGILEEVVFRGVLLRELLPISRSLAIGLTSAVYAAVHLRETGMTALTWLELGGLFLLGGVLAVSCLRTGSLWTAIGLHAVLAYGARVNKLVLAIPESTWWWLTGTSRLINGVAAWLLICLAGWIVWNWGGQQGRRQLS